MAAVTAERGSDKQQQNPNGREHSQRGRGEGGRTTASLPAATYQTPAASTAKEAGPTQAYPQPPTIASAVLAPPARLGTQHTVNKDQLSDTTTSVT